MIVTAAPTISTTGNALVAKNPAGLKVAKSPLEM
jgi:hypothetical protein